MLKISDILKKHKKEKKDKADVEKHHQPKEPVQPPQVEQAPLQQEKEKPEPEKKPVAQEVARNEEQKISEQVKPALKKDDSETIALYNQAISAVQGIMSLYDSEKQGAFDKAKQIIKQFVQILNTDENSLLRLFFDEYHVEKGYLYQHCVNVCVFCLRLGIALDYDFEHLSQLGLAALVHDIGAKEFDQIISRPSILSDKEFMEVKKHPIVGKDVLKKIAHDLKFEIYDVVHQEHERIDGSGYPYGLKSQEICDYAKLIGVADVFEALCHARPYRRKYRGINVIKELLSSKNKFETKYLKVLIDIAGVFPVSSMVKLNTKEIAVVDFQNEQMPFRPVIRVISDAHGQALEQPKSIDLSRNFSVYIQDIYEQNNLK